MDKQPPDVFAELNTPLRMLLEQYTSKRRLVAILDSTTPEEKWLNYDPLKKELKIPVQYIRLLGENRTNEESVQKYGESELLVHEKLHSNITEREYQYYGSRKLISFDGPLALLSGQFFDDAPSLSRESFEVFSQSAAVTAYRLGQSELVQEGIALDRQIQYLQRLDILEDFQYQLDIFNLGEEVDRFLDAEENASEYLKNLQLTNPSHCLLQSPKHAIGHWLYSQASGNLGFDIADVAFQYYMKVEGDPKFEIRGFDPEYLFPIPADGILLIAALSSKSTFEGRSRDEIEELLKRMGGIWAKESQLTSEMHQGEVSLIDPQIQKKDVIYEKQRKQRLEQILTQRRPELYSIVPIISLSYPGINNRHNLWNILSNLSVITDPNGKRTLWCTSDVFEWAADTELINLGLETWRLRENTFIPMYETYRVTDFHTEKFLDAIEDGRIPEGWWKHTALDHDRTPMERYELNYEDYSEMITLMRTLGEAIVNEKTGIVRQFL